MENYLAKMNYAFFPTLAFFMLINPMNWNTTASSSAVKAKTFFELISYQEVVEMTLEFDMEAMIENRRNEESDKGLLTFKDEEGNTQEWLTKVSQRGKFRRMKCTEMPPLKLKFKKDQLRTAQLMPYNDLKLVTYCVNDRIEAKELLMKEYLAYKMYNSLTDASYRVQLVRMTYKDSKSRKKTKHWGFLIEDTAELRARLGADKCESCYGLPEKEFQQDLLKTMMVFQYMIGNSDWSHTGGQNIKRVIKDNQYLAIPYDFDFSGLVAAPYATLNSDFGQTYPGERHDGFIKDIDPADKVFQDFKDKRARLTSIIKDFKHLRSSTKKECLAYLDIFFTQLKGDKVYSSSVSIGE